MPKRKRSSFSSSIKRYAKKKSRGRGRKIYKAKRKSIARTKKRMYKSSRAINHPRWYTPAAPRVRTKHRNVISVKQDIGGGSSQLFRSAAQYLLPLRLRDPDSTVQNQPYPEKFIELCRLYSRYRVFGVRVRFVFHDIPSTQKSRFWSTVFSTSTKDGAFDPYLSVTSRETRDSYIQNPMIRKKYMVGNGINNQPRVVVHNVGYFNIGNIEEMRRIDMDDDEFSGHVNTDGTEISPPTRTPKIWYALCQPYYEPLTGSPGFDDAMTVSMRIELTFDCEWFDRRDVLTPTFTDE